MLLLKLQNVERCKELAGSGYSFPLLSAYHMIVALSYGDELIKLLSSTSMLFVVAGPGAKFQAP